MAKRGQSISWIFPGLFSVTFIGLIFYYSIGQLVLYAFDLKSDAVSFVLEAYFWQLVKFTFYQASLSTLISLIVAFLLAKALADRHFVGKDFLLKILSVSFILPTLVVILGIMSVYGREGWLAQIFNALDIDYTFSLYGLSGILLAHVFYNFPFAFRIFAQALASVPSEHHQLSAQLGFNRWQHFLYLEWPHLRRQILPTASLIFMLCFTSFAVVLTLGGGPGATTIEVAIYQAIRDFEWLDAVTMSLIQLLFCLIILFTLRSLSPVALDAQTRQNQGFRRRKTTGQTVIDVMIIVFSLTIILPPLLAIIVDGVQAIHLSNLKNAHLWQATFTSLMIALSAGILALSLSLLLLWTSRHCYWRGNILWAQNLILCGMLILGIPSMILSAGFFLSFQSVLNVTFLPFLFIIITNSLMAMPFVIKILETPMNDSQMHYYPLSQTLRLTGWKRFYWVDFLALKAPIRLAFGFACLISLGDFGIIALFGNENMMTLPYYLYQQIGAYRLEESALTALLLLMLSLGLFSLTSSQRPRI